MSSSFDFIPAAQSRSRACRACAFSSTTEACIHWLGTLGKTKFCCLLSCATLMSGEQKSNNMIHKRPANCCLAAPNAACPFHETFDILRTSSYGPQPTPYSEAAVRQTKLGQSLRVIGRGMPKIMSVRQPYATTLFAMGPSLPSAQWAPEVSTPVTGRPSV